MRSGVDPQALLGHPAEPLLVVGPVLEVHAAGQADPRRVAVVSGVDAVAEVELAAQDVRAAAGVDDPASGGDCGLVLLRHENRVRLRAELDVLHTPATERFRPRLLGPPEQLVLEPPAVDLMGERVEVTRRAELDALGDVRVVAGGHEEPQTELALLVLLEVIAHPDHLAVVIGADLDARLPDLERRLGRGLGPLVGDEHAGVGTLALELNRDRQPGEAATEDRHVVMAVRCIDRHRLEHRRRTVVCHQLLLGWSGSQVAAARAMRRVPLGKAAPRSHGRRAVAWHRPMRRRSPVGVSKPRVQPPRRSTSNRMMTEPRSCCNSRASAVHPPFIRRARRPHPDQPDALRTAGSRRRTPRSPTRR